MPVRFDGGEASSSGAHSKFGLLEPEPVSRVSLLEPDYEEPSSEALARLLDTRQIAAAEKELRRQKQLAAFGKKVLAIMLTGSVLAFGFCIGLLAVYVHLQPVVPHFEVMGAGFVSVNIQPLSGAQIAQQQASGTGNYFAAYFTFNSSYTIMFQNPNPKVDLFVEELELKLFYEGFPMGSIKKRDFAQPRSTSQVFKMFIATKNLPVPLKVYYTMFLVIGKKNYFGADLLMKGRMSSVAGLKSPPFLLRVRCTLVLKSYVVIARSCFHRNVA